MLQLQQNPLSLKDAEAIYNWLNRSEALLAFNVILGMIAKLQVEAAMAALEVSERPGMQLTVDERLREALRLKKVLETLTWLKEKAGDLTLTEVSVDHAASNQFATIGSKPTH